MGWQTRLESIRANNTSGAAELAREAALAVSDWIEHTRVSSLSAWRAEVTALGEALHRAQPSMAPLFNLANQILLAVESTTTLPQAQYAVGAVVQTFLEHLVRSQEALVAAALPLIAPGADSLTPRGVINKLGTTGVALACGMATLPCYLVCGKQKWVPAAASAAALPRVEAPREVWDNPAPGIEVWNGYFETTPLDLFSRIIAEVGILSPAEVLRQLTTMPLAAALSPRG